MHKTLVNERLTRDLLHLAVEEKGRDYNYRNANPDLVSNVGCSYFHPDTGEASCIVGHVLAYLGVSIHDIGYELNADQTAHTLFNALRTMNIIAIDDESVELLRIAQLKQDSGATWGEAVDQALNGAQL